MAKYKHAYAPDVRARANNANTPGPGVIPNIKITIKNDIELLIDMTVNGLFYLTTFITLSVIL